MSIRLLAMDMDDTFLHSDKSISPENIRAVRDAAAQGIVVVPASGRPRHMIPPQLTDLDGVRYLITVNGSRVRDLYTGEYIYSNLIPYEDVLGILACAARFRTVCEVCVEEVFYVTQAEEEQEFAFVSPSLEWFIRSMHTCVPSLMDTVREKRSGSEKMLVFFHDPAEKEIFRREVIERYHVTVSASLPGELELTAGGVSKGTALLYTAQQLGFSREETMAVGDSENDLDMLKAAGFSVAMGNAGEELKRAADAVTDHCDDDGFAHAVYRWALGGK